MSKITSLSSRPRLLTLAVVLACGGTAMAAPDLIGTDPFDPAAGSGQGNTIPATDAALLPVPQPSSGQGLSYQEDILAITVLVTTGDLPAALAKANALVAQAPREAVAYHLLGMVHLARHDQQQAAEALRQALELAPTLTAARLQLAALEADRGHLRQAQALYRQVLEDPTKRLPALLGLARLTRQEGDFQGALDWLEQARTLGRDSPLVTLEEIQLHLAQGEADRAVTLATALVQARSEDDQARLLLAVALREAGQPARALEQFAQLTQRLPQVANVWYQQALTQERDGQQQAALASLDQALAADETHPGAWHLRILLLLATGQTEAALAGARELQQKFPDRELGYLLEGDILVHQDDLAAGIEAYQQAHHRQPAPATVLALARALLAADQSEAAIQLARHHLAAYPDHRQSHPQLLVLATTGQLPGATLQVSGSLKETLGESLPRYRQALVSGDVDHAVALAEGMLDSLPRRADALVLLGTALMEDDQPARLERAREVFRQALELEPEHTAARVNLARLHLKTGKLVQAETLYREVLARDEKSLVAMVDLAALAKLRQQPEESIGWLQRAWQHYPGALALGLTLITELRQQQRDGEALSLAETLAETHPDDPSVLENLGELLLNLRRPREGREVMERLTRLVPDQPGNWQRLATAEAALGHSQGVIDALNRALELQPDSLPALATRTRFHLQVTGNWEAAQADIQTLQQAHPDQAAGFRLEGDLLMARGVTDRAIAAYRTAHDRAGETETALVLAQAHWLTGQPQAATGVLEQWLETHDADRQARLQLALYLQQTGDRQGAIEQFVRLQEQVPDNPIVLNELASLYQQQGQPDQAIRHARQALELAPDQPAIMDTLGWSLVNGGQVEEGRGWLERAAAHSTAMPRLRATVLFHLAVSYQRSGQVQAAQRSINDALASGVAFPERAEAESLLASLAGP